MAPNTHFWAMAPATHFWAAPLMHGALVPAAFALALIAALGVVLAVVLRLRVPAGR